MPDRTPADDEAFVTLVLRYLDGIATSREEAELEAKLAEPSNESQRKSFVTISRQRGQMFEALAPGRLKAAVPGLHDIRRGTSRRWRWTAAAAIVLIGFASWFAFGGRTAALPAIIDRIQGRVVLLRESGTEPAFVGAEIRAGEALRTEGPGSQSTLRFQDGSVLTVAENSLVRREAKGEKGERVRLDSGSILADIRRQEKHRAMTFATPHGEAVVVGTSLKLVVDPSARGSTRLEVTEGLVRLANLAGKVIDVPNGYFAVATAGSGELKALRSSPRGLVGHWTFDGPGGPGVRDESGMENHGSVIGNARPVEGKWGKALEFDGTASVEVPHRPSLNPGALPWTVAAWIRRESDSPNRGMVVYKDDGNFHSYYFLQAGLYPHFEVSTGSSSVRVEAKIKIADGKWHHLAGVRVSPTVAQLYVDGVLAESASIPPPPSPLVTTTGPFRIGDGNPAFRIASLNPFQGAIDDVRIYDRALTPEEIARLYSTR
jgi:hypothetical protein